VLNLLDGVGPETAARGFAFVQERGFDPRVIGQFDRNSGGDSGNPFPSTRAARDSIRRLSRLFDEVTGNENGLPLSGQLECIRRFYEPLLTKAYENPEPRLHDIEQLEHIARGYRSRRKFLTDLALDPPTSTSDLAGVPTLDEDWLTLSTIHSAKGCEWDVVYLIHATDGILPSDLATGDARQIEEERRLLYVACTRAKDWLYVLFPLRYYHRKHRLGDSHSYAQRTRFIPPPVARFFETASAASNESQEEIAGKTAAPANIKDIRNLIRSRWE
jgi:DNA helicase-2/ATP-dependent DNA helicase PcrA